jgi:hypothetical protein
MAVREGPMAALMGATKLSSIVGVKPGDISFQGEMEVIPLLWMLESSLGLVKVQATGSQQAVSNKHIPYQDLWILATKSMKTSLIMRTCFWSSFLAPQRSLLLLLPDMTYAVG